MTHHELAAILVSEAAVDKLVNDGYMLSSPKGCKLTPEGYAEARRLWLLLGPGTRLLFGALVKATLTPQHP